MSETLPVVARVDDRPTPASLEDLDEAWVVAALRGAGLAERATITALDDVGEGRGFTGAVVRATYEAEGAARSIIVKLAGGADEWERASREAWFHAGLAEGATLPLPRARLAVVDAVADRVALLFDFIEGRDGDAALGCDAADARRVVESIAALHAAWWESAQLDLVDWLPTWGRGEAGKAFPHRRRATRYARRLDPFLERYGADAMPGFAELARALVPRFESVLETVAALPVTLIHADLHLDNVIFDAGGAAVLLDWQSLSIGPASYDVARFMTDGPADGPPGARAVADAWVAALAAAGGPVLDRRSLDLELRDMLLRVLAGFVSGYGGREPASLHPREQVMIRRAVGPTGLAGVVLDWVERFGE